MNLRHRLRRWYLRRRGYGPPTCTECGDTAHFLIGDEPRCVMHQKTGSPVALMRDVTIDDWVKNE